MVLQILSLLICCTIVQIGHAMTRIKCWKFSKHDLFTCSDVSSHFGTVSCDFELRYLDLWMANFYFVWFPSWLWKLVLPQYFEHFLTYTIKVFYKPHRCNVIFFSSPSSVVALGCQPLVQWKPPTENTHFSISMCSFSEQVFQVS